MGSTGRGAPSTSGFRMRGDTAPIRALTAISTRRPTATAIQTAAFSTPLLPAGSGLLADETVSLVATGLLLTKPVDEMRVDAVGVQFSGHQVSGAHPRATRPFAQGDTGSRGARGGGQHLDALQCLFDAAWAQRVGIGECAHQGGGDVPVHDCHTERGATAAVLLGIAIEEVLTDRVALVVLIDADPAHERV